MLTRMRLIALISGILLGTAAVGLAYVWFACRVVVGPEQGLVLIKKSGAALPPGQTIASAGQKGIQRETLGPGQYFLNPWTTDYELVKLLEIPAGDPQTWAEYYRSGADVNPPSAAGAWPMVGVVTNKVGKPAPVGQEVVDEGFQGIQRRVLTPGVYRINPYIYDVKLEPATIVPLGHCGVVTSLLGEMPGTETVRETSIGPDGQPIEGETKIVQRLAEAGQRGVRRDVLSPGIYYLNPKVYKVQVVQVGYNQISQLTTGDASEHIKFPSRDGFTIDVEVTVVWGRNPAFVAEMVNRFGDAELIKQLIIGQMRSICRNVGSQYESTDFISGEKREAYQREVTETLKTVCGQRDIEILIALIRNIEVQAGEAARGESLDLKKTIQRGFIAREQELTKQAERETAKIRAQLETAKAGVDVAREKVASDTRLKVASIKAEADKSAQEILAQRDLEVAKIEQQIATLEAEARLVTGRAQTQVEELSNQAEADGKRMMVEAFGSGSAYNLYTFAESFAPESIRLIFAGEGTFWTDLSKLQDVANMQMLREPPRRTTE